MSIAHRNLERSALLLCLALSGCTLGPGTVDRNVASTIVAATISALQTNAVATQTQQAASIPPPNSTLSETATIEASITPTPQNPLVSQSTLCWGGPGPAYEVISSVAAGTRVVVLGVGSLPGWFVIQNPIYHDRCWIEARYLQLDPGYAVTDLKVFNPPPTPGPKITPGPSPTP